MHMYLLYTEMPCDQAEQNQEIFYEILAFCIEFTFSCYYFVQLGVSLSANRNISDRTEVCLKAGHVVTSTNRSSLLLHYYKCLSTIIVLM